jgi:hypothetical protein
MARDQHRRRNLPRRTGRIGHLRHPRGLERRTSRTRHAMEDRRRRVALASQTRHEMENHGVQAARASHLTAPGSLAIQLDRARAGQLLMGRRRPDQINPAGPRLNPAVKIQLAPVRIDVPIRGSQSLQIQINRPQAALCESYDTVGNKHKSSAFLSPKRNNIIAESGRRQIRERHSHSWLCLLVLDFSLDEMSQ